MISQERKRRRVHLGIYSPSCFQDNEVSSKIGSLIVLQSILGITVDADSIQRRDMIGFETIVAASSVPAVEGIQVEVA